MSFSTQWLGLREPLDLAARNGEILNAVADHLKNIDKPTITDIACGTGSTQRALAPFQPNNTKWHLIDIDPQLIKMARKNTNAEMTSYHQIDLMANMDAVFELPSSLVTTSAFLDLVSQEWLEKFIYRLSKHKLPLYAALSYDGRALCAPKLANDDEIIEMHNLHQQTDKGFGVGLGKDATASAINLLEQHGYQTISGTSHWHADGNHIAFQKQLFEGWCSAACEINLQRRSAYQQWLANRFSFLDEGQAQLKVGHIDLFAIPKV